jgi:hypothetical protein
VAVVPYSYLDFPRTAVVTIPTIVAPITALIVIPIIMSIRVSGSYNVGVTEGFVPKVCSLFRRSRQ